MSDKWNGDWHWSEPLIPLGVGGWEAFHPLRELDEQIKDHLAKFGNITRQTAGEAAVDAYHARETTSRIEQEVAQALRNLTHRVKQLEKLAKNVDQY